MNVFAHKHRIQLPGGQVIYTDRDYLRGLMENQAGGPGAPQLSGHAYGPPVPQLGHLGHTWGPPAPVRLSGAGTWQLGQTSPAAASPYDTRLGTGLYATLTLAAAMAGGATVGFVASGSMPGAITGGAFTAGFSALSSSTLYAREGNPGGAWLMAALGLGALGTSFYRFAKGQQGAGGRGLGRQADWE